ncbi:formate dehydrogenase accessory sulfurtransferase FdhD [Listeria fleischmannii]|uniref:formate dehydrogenase accessory sulfurtransferase FdhD n=1 Tax=Listeria fleischmannii TaxID=1069827 RepID=UPI00162AD247|nr:formate dehydrogenase accessory sulfurtransferase FdhD [Listeria fleischmannii]MBC1418722.1 formate dehydrogenase accessory sulfurtransferase FdhD [Listeria fleischmannii]
MEVSVRKTIIRFENGEKHEQNAEVAVEYPLTIYVNKQELVTIVCTPEYLEDLIIGFLTSEGVIRGISDIDNIEIIEATGHAYVTANFVNQFNAKYRSKRYITSCCGKSRENFYFQSDASLLESYNETEIFIRPKQIFDRMAEFENSSATFHQTGGVHNAGLTTPDGLICSRMDIGRHNALDKIYGYCLKNEIPVSDKIVIFSGRISSEILVKTAKLGCGIILSRSAPTELAINMAEELGITTVGFIRNGTMNVYTNGNRILMD